MNTHKLTLRKVRPLTLRALLRIIAEHPDGVKWDQVCSRAKSSGELIKSASNARTWHYSSVLRCLNLAAAPQPGRYRVTALGHQLLQEAGTGGDTFSDGEIKVLRGALLNCEPCRQFLGFFLGVDEVNSLSTALESGMPIFCSFDRQSGEVENSYGLRKQLSSRTEVNQWQDGIIDLCKQIRIVDELRLPKGIIENIPSNHIIFLTRDQTITFRWLEDVLQSDHRLGTDTGRVYIPRLIYHLSTQYRIRVQELRDALINYVTVNKSKVYLDRVSELSVKNHEPCFLEVDGVWRSSIIYG